MSFKNQENNQSQENLEDLVQELSHKLTLQKKVVEWLAVVNALRLHWHLILCHRAKATQMR